MIITTQKLNLVYPSPWPVVAAISASMVTFGGILHKYCYRGGASVWKFGSLMILFMMFCFFCSKDLGGS
jgi:hypothetical protein